MSGGGRGRAFGAKGWKWTFCHRTSPAWVLWGMGRREGIGQDWVEYLGGGGVTRYKVPAKVWRKREQVPPDWRKNTLEVRIRVRGWSPSCEEDSRGWRKQLIYWCRWSDWCHCRWRCYSCLGTRAGWSISPSSEWNHRLCHRWGGCWVWSLLS